MKDDFIMKKNYSLCKIKEVERMFYVLEIHFKKSNTYYAVDTKLTFTRNIQDAIVFSDKCTAELFAGPIECALEELTQNIVSVYVKAVNISFFPL